MNDVYTNICVFGDSVPFGRIDPKNGGWVNMLKTYVESAKSFNKVFGLGIPGNNTIKLLARIKNELSVRKKDVVIIQIGTNDASKINGKNVVSIEEFGKNILNIVKICKSFSSKIIFVGLLGVDESRSMPLPVFLNPKIYFSKEDQIKYNDVLKNICVKNNLMFISIYGLLDIEKDLADGVHPNASGHRKIFKKILSVVDELIEKR